METSGTGNMKLALNGALTIGTLDGANVEIRERVGADNFFLFGLTTDEVLEHKRRGHRPREFYDSQPMLRAVIDAIASGQFSPGDSALFRPVVDELLQTDQYMLMADFDAYVKCQEVVDAAWRNADDWTRKTILNIAQMGTFSSDRSVRDYARDIWDIKPVL